MSLATKGLKSLSAMPYLPLKRENKIPSPTDSPFYKGEQPLPTYSTSMRLVIQQVKSAKLDIEESNIHREI